MSKKVDITNINSIDSLSLKEVIQHVNDFESGGCQSTPLKIVFLRNITIDPIIPYLKFLGMQSNLSLQIDMGNYDTIMQDVLDESSPLYNEGLDVIVIVLKLETFAEKLVYDFCGMSDEEVVGEEKRIVDSIDRIVSTIRSKSKTMLLLHNFEVPVFPAFGILDYQYSSMQVNTIRKLNLQLVELVQRYTSTYIVDMDLLQTLVGYSKFIDNRYWHIGKCPYSRDAFKAIAKEYMKFINAVKGKNRKCLVLDCDNTLWGGIIGEDGFNKIKIGKTYPGSPYLELQRGIVNLFNRGVLLAVCSKNNDKDVMEVFERHSDMVLRRKHILSFKINWDDKVTNIRNIAKELNIGLDSIVFMDDSHFEVNMLKEMMPEVAVIQMPKDPTLASDLLNSCALFDTVTLSQEDKKRNEMYVAERERKEAMVAFERLNLKDYYKYLEMEVFIGSADEFSIPRISQLTQRTNQFNLTTRRYSESEIKALAESKDADVRYLQLKDRFGDSGIVGVAILKYQGVESLVDSFLFSCRVIGRGLEEVLLKGCVNRAVSRGCKTIIGTYIATKKNGQVEKFYENHNFTFIRKDNDESAYSFLLEEGFPDFPDYFKTIQIDTFC